MLALAFKAPVTALGLYSVVHGYMHYENALIGLDSALLAGILTITCLVANLLRK